MFFITTFSNLHFLIKKIKLVLTFIYFKIIPCLVLYFIFPRAQPVINLFRLMDYIKSILELDFQILELRFLIKASNFHSPKKLAIITKF